MEENTVELNSRENKSSNFLNSKVDVEKASSNKIVFWIIMFPPVGLFLLSKEKKLHIWFSYVLIFFGVFYFIPVFVQILFVYPKLLSLYSDMGVSFDTGSFRLYAFGISIFLILEILFGFFLISKTKKEGFLKNYYIIPAILILLSQYFLMALFIRSMIYQTIAPIYTLTSSLDTSSTGGYKTIPTPTPVNKASSKLTNIQNSEISHVQVYKDEIAYFEYPLNWSKNEYENGPISSRVDFTDTDSRFVLIYQTRANVKKGSSEPYANLNEYIKEKYDEALKKPTSISGKGASETFPRAGSENISEAVFFSFDNSKIITIRLETGKDVVEKTETEVAEERKLFDEILESFKFRWDGYNLSGPKSALVSVKDGSWYGPPYDAELYELVSTPGNNLFAKSNMVDLEKYLGKEVGVNYRDVEGVIMGEQQLVIIESIKE